MPNLQDQKQNSNAKPPSAAPPPWHSVLFILIMISGSIWNLPSLESIDQVATIDAFTTPVIPPFGSARSSLVTMGLVRLSFALFIFIFLIYRIVDPQTFEFETSPLQSSKLRKNKIQLKGFRRNATFTMWSFLFLGCSFLGSAIITLQIAFDNDDTTSSKTHISPWLLRFSLLSFEIAAPSGFLVSTVVRYALWPNHLAQQGSKGTIGFRSFYGLVSHNANIFFILVESCLLGGLPVRMEHIAFAPTLGIVYIVFTWWMSTRWTTANNGDGNRSPNFIYFFLDTTLGWTTSKALVVLLLVLIIFFVLLSQVNLLLEQYLGNALLPRLIAMSGIALCVCRFQD